MQKHIGAPHAKDLGLITVKFADRCYEYQDAGIPIIPTTLRTHRLYFFSIMPVTFQIVSGGQVQEMIILN